MRVHELNAARLDECPVWTWDDSRDYIVPIGKSRVLPTDTDTLFVRATLIAANGTHLDGVIVDPPVPFALEIIVGTQSVGFNLNAPEYAQQELRRLFELLGTAPFDLFPLRYETDYHFPNEPNVAGVFDMEVS